VIQRGNAGAMIEGAEEAAARVLNMVEAGAVITAGGKYLPTPIRSICVHGDQIMRWRPPAVFASAWSKPVSL